MEGSKPDLIVAVDFGMTCTGVSYANLSIGAETVKWIQKWPGRGQANENKVPTVLVYPIGSSELSSWGFQSESPAELHSPHKEFKEWFKTFLDPARLAEKQRTEPDEAFRSIEEVEKCYEDYLRKLYNHIQSKLGPELRHDLAWQHANIEFIFSVPTTWSPAGPTVQRFRLLIERAGFGQHVSHSLSIGLTEAEAAAVFVSTEAKGIFKADDVLLVCDAGGGTTDLSVLKVTDTLGGHITLQQLDVVFGDTIGSAAIDYEFEKLVHSRLEAANRDAPLFLDIDRVSWDIMKGREFQNIKCEHGSSDDTPEFLITIPGIDRQYISQTYGIYDGDMKLSRVALHTLFDRQVEKMFRLIDSQLLSMLSKHPSLQVTHLVLSGGLGNSPYVQQRLRSYYSSGANGRHPNAQNLHVRIAEDPQLAVCKGMVVDRVRKLRIGKIQYNRDNPAHVGKRIAVDPMDGNTYVSDAVAWFVKKGEPVHTDSPLVKEFATKRKLSDSRDDIPTQVVTSDVEPHDLPLQINANARKMCKLKSDLSSADTSKFKLKNRHCWSFGKKYYRIDYEIRVVVGPADLRFELWFANQKISHDRSIKVDWEVSAPPPSRPQKPANESTYYAQTPVLPSSPH